LETKLKQKMNEKYSRREEPLTNRLKHT